MDWGISSLTWALRGLVMRVVVGGVGWASGVGWTGGFASALCGRGQAEWWWWKDRGISCGPLGAGSRPCVRWTGGDEVTWPAVVALCGDGPGEKGGLAQINPTFRWTGGEAVSMDWGRCVDLCRSRRGSGNDARWVYNHPFRHYLYPRP